MLLNLIYFLKLLIHFRKIFNNVQHLKPISLNALIRILFSWDILLMAKFVNRDYG